MSDNKKNIAVLLGDPSGIGPELIVKLLDNKICNDSNIVVIGEKKILEDGEKIVGKKTNLKFVENFKDINFNGDDKFFLDISKGANRNYKLSEGSAEAGKTVLDALE